MHIPDGIINGAASAGFGAVAAGGFGAALRATRDRLADRHVPLVVVFLCADCEACEAWRGGLLADRALARQLDEWTAPVLAERTQLRSGRSKRSSSMTLVQAATKSSTN